MLTGLFNDTVFTPQITQRYTNPHMSLRSQSEYTSIQTGISCS